MPTTDAYTGRVTHYYRFAELLRRWPPVPREARQVLSAARTGTRRDLHFCDHIFISTSHRTPLDEYAAHFIMR